MIKNRRIKSTLSTKDFDYHLPPEQIAQSPAEPRDAARLMVLDRKTRKIEHKVFRDIIDFLKPGDALVINDSRVIPARLYGIKADTGVTIETVLLRQRETDLWECIVRPGRRCRIGTDIIFGEGLARAKVVDQTPDGNRMIFFEYDKSTDNFYTLLEKIGQMPLPPYITKKLENKEDYQTVYARDPGSAAAPTAGLHFTDELLERIEKKGIRIVRVMLHVGLGTFRPVKVDRVEEHVMHSEYFEVSAEAAEALNRTRASGGRIVCVGTTSCRTLESCTDDAGIVHAMCDDTAIFIYPGYRFKATDALITNFHLPQSTLLMLVSALSDRDFILESYNTAVREGYRFFSFGDACLIV